MLLLQMKRRDEKEEKERKVNCFKKFKTLLGEKRL
jgi:hypothetical protein